ncbi:MAG: exodeoxyribonuclease VII large subunit [bacterium]|nr:exodeoxyribonuclease VII large subunit [bacterium]
MAKQMELTNTAGAGEEVFQVSEFNQFINNLISLRQFKVEGEISEINIRQNRWVFITLKDPEKEEVLKVFSTFYQVRENLEFLQVGALVQVCGYPKLYGKSGRFSLSAYKILPVGDGKLQRAFLELKAKLQAEGLFDESRKRRLPGYPRAVFLLTAPESRAYSDFIKVTQERGFGVIKIKHVPISAQGAEAVPSILRAFRLVRAQADEADLAVITRGGGSLEDLQAFNDEEVVRAAFGLPIPLVSAIGHEADVSLIDYVADVRASTPSNAAEIIFPSLAEVGQEVELLSRSLAHYMNQKLEAAWYRFMMLKKSLAGSFTAPMERLSNLETRLKSLLVHYHQRLGWLEGQLPVLSARLVENQAQALRLGWQRYRQYKSLVISFDPRAVLKRGYSITTDASGRLIKDAGQIQINKVLMTYLRKGKIKSQVKEVYEK